VLRLCDEVLRGAGLTPGDLGAIACGAGPGSFTGLRVGLSIAKGLALATGAPLILVGSLEALALDILDAAPGARAVPCIDAGKGEVYAAVHGAGDSEGDGGGTPWEAPWRLTPGALAARLDGAGRYVVAGNGADRYATILDASLPPGARRAQVPGPTPLAIGRLALPRYRRGDTDDLASATPRYGRPPDITAPKR
jgi:tRNA threonylcarbamoyladenosine biosynthesis protein TsaB